MTQILQGIRIIDAGTVLASPGLCALLSDFGAEVIKVEQPVDGDPLRRYPPHVDGQSLTSKVTNRNKYSATLDLRDERGRELFRGLVATADAVVLNYRLPTLRRWGLDYDQLRAVRPDLVMLHLTGYGRTGPYADRPGFARVAEAFIGLTYMTGYPDRSPIPSGYAVADAIGAVYGAYSLLLALFHQKATGTGQLVDLALYEATMRVLDGVYVGYDQAGRIPEREGTINPGIAPHDIYPTADEAYISLPVSTQNMFVRLCEVIGHPDLPDDPRFATNVDRVAHRAELDAYVAPFIRSRTAAEFLALTNAVGIAASRINNVADFVDDPHVKERGSLTAVPDPNLDRDILMQAVFPLLSETPGAISWPGREPGQDNEYVYRRLLGLAPDRLDALSRDGVI